MVCHGAGGTGNGPMAGELKTPPSDLTQISARHNGVFPFDAIYAKVDGREMVAAHGTTDMPVWGDVYRADVSTMTGERTATQGELNAGIAGRVLSLVYYLQSIQAR